MSTFTYALHDAMPDACRGAVLTIGNFDGVHRGHQALLAETVRQARQLGVASIAVTFDPPPVQLLRPDRAGPLLTSIDDRALLLHQCCVDHVLILRTSSELLHLSARAFFEEIVVRQLQAKALVEGFNFAFGRGREGTIDVLKQLGSEHGVAVTFMPPQEVDGQPVSSSRVRADLLAGRVDVVARLLGRPYRLAGVVGTGQKRGATIGFPTANLQDIKTLTPGDGVYAVRVWVSHASYPAAANVGPNPTFGENARKVEVHLIGFRGELYGQTLSVEYMRKIRDTKAFASVQELVAQIGADVEEAKRIVYV